MFYFRRLRINFYQWIGYISGICFVCDMYFWKDLSYPVPYSDDKGWEKELLWILFINAKGTPENYVE